MAAPSESFTVIPDTQVDADSPITEDLMTALAHNDIHLEEWMGKDYAAAQNHDHDGVNSKGVNVPANTIGNSELALGTSGSGSQVITAAATYVPPARLATYVSTAALGDIALEVNVGGWRRARDAEACVYSDGTNVRFQNTTGFSRTLYFINLA